MRPAPETRSTSAPAACSTVLFDGSCPLCSCEIAMYRALPSEGSIAWVDISVTGYVPPAGTSQAALMRRFHTVTPAGVLLSGASAFVHVWSLLPGWRHLARMARLPGVTPLMEMTYRLFLHLRPWMQSAYRRLV